MTFRGPAWFVQATVGVGTTATIISLILLYLEFSGRAEDVWQTGAYLLTDTILCGFMLAEWFILLYLVDDRRKYIKARWIDLLASIPLLLIARPLRIIRLLRILRLLRGIALFSRAMRPWEKALDVSLLKTAALAATVVIVVASMLIMDLERDNPQLNTFGEALWWSIVTSTTVGYGDRVPLTQAGQFVAVGLMVLGIGLFGTLAATLTSVLKSDKAHDVSNEDLMQQLQALRDEVAALREAVSRRGEG